MILLILKAIHLFAAFAWMAGLWYHPRLLIYQREIYDKEGNDAHSLGILRIMSLRLMRFILMPSMAITIVMGFSMLLAGDYWSEGWVYAKLFCVLLLLCTSIYLSRIGREMRTGYFRHNTRQLRVINEIPTVILVAILFFVVVYPSL